MRAARGPEHSGLGPQKRGVCDSGGAWVHPQCKRQRKGDRLENWIKKGRIISRIKGSFIRGILSKRDANKLDGCMLKS